LISFDMNFSRATAIVVGAGPAGLMAAETLADQGFQVDVYDAMASAGRKFLIAGRGGMNLTHSEEQRLFCERYYERKEQITPMLEHFSSLDMRRWAEELGIATFVGTSGRVFPVDMKAAPLLRAWLQRIRSKSVQFHMRHRWLDWRGENLLFQHEGQQLERKADVVVFALGGASWPQLGSTGAWCQPFLAQSIQVNELQPSNCGFTVEWSAHLKERCSGHALTSVAIMYRDLIGDEQYQKGQLIISEYGVEGSLIYAASACLRRQIHTQGFTHIYLDLLPDHSFEKVHMLIAHSQGSKSLSSHLKSKLNLDAAKLALLYECSTAEQRSNSFELTKVLKRLPIRLDQTRPIAEAISSAGGVRFETMDTGLMLTNKPGHFCAGEMLDWEAPTGGYLLTACMAMGRHVGLSAANWLKHVRDEHVQLEQ
jgi:uncharacterized flavoprotein (TIGR03862 family)